jgi:hypothetical protein
MFKDYLSKNSIVFVDVDETLFRTFAKIHVVKNDEVIKKLDNKDFNSYVLGEGESFDFHEFRSGKLFKETSIPIPQTMNKLKNLISKIKEIRNACADDNCSKIIFLTAREDFFDKQNFLEAFRNQGIDIDDKKLMYIERAGNLKESSVPEKKKKIMMKYLSSGKYDFVQMIDDDEKNIEVLKEIAYSFPMELLEKLKLNYSKNVSEPIIGFQGFLVQDNGDLKFVFEKNLN